MRTYFNRNPFFRKNLIKSITNQTLVKVSRMYWGKKGNRNCIENEVLMDIYLFEFSNISVFIYASTPRKMIIYENCYYTVSPIIQFGNRQQSLSERFLSPLKMDYELKKENLGLNLGDLYNSKIINIELLFEGNKFMDFARIKNTSLKTVSGVRGIRINFNLNRSLMVFLSYNLDVTPLIVTKDNFEIENQILEPKELFSEKKIYENILIENLGISPNFLRKEKLIKKFLNDKKNKINDPKNILSHRQNVSKNISNREFTKREVFYNIKQLKQIKDILQKEQFGLVDLKFEILDNGEITIRKPVDIVPFLEENIQLIDRIIKALQEKLIVKT